MEALLKLKPDLVLTWTFKPDLVRFMEERGLKVIAIYPESLPELYDVMRLDGEALRAGGPHGAGHRGDGGDLPHGKGEGRRTYPTSGRKKVLYLAASRR